MAQKDTIETLLGHMPVIIRTTWMSVSDRYMCAAALGYVTAGMHLDADEIEFLQGVVDKFRERELALANAQRETVTDEKEA